MFVYPADKQSWSGKSLHSYFLPEQHWRMALERCNEWRDTPTSSPELDQLFFLTQLNGHASRILKLLVVQSLYVSAPGTISLG